MCTLILYYTALYNDNLNLLSKLLEICYNFGNKRYYLKLFALDKRITEKFEVEQYCELLTNQNSIFENFYNSLSEEEIETELTEEELIKINEYEENLFNKHFEPYHGANIDAIRRELNDELTKNNPKKRGLGLFRKNR